MKLTDDRVFINARKHKNDHKLCGKAYNTINGLCSIISYINCDNVKVRFIDTGYIAKTKISHLIDGQVKDYLYPSVIGVGFLGNDFKRISKGNSPLHRKIYNVWNHMLRRCYDKTDSRYHVYGGVGVMVDKRWHNYSKFFYDIQKLTGYDKDLILSKDNKTLIQLDKDKLQCDRSSCEKVYSKHTCCWLNNLQQGEYLSSTIKIKVFSKNGEMTNEPSISEASRKYGLNSSHVVAILLHGYRKQHKGYTFEYA